MTELYAFEVATFDLGHPVINRNTSIEEIDTRWNSI